MKKILTFIVTLFSVLCFIILFNTLTLKPEIIDNSPIEKLKVSDEAINRFSGAIKFKTISTGNSESDYSNEFVGLHKYFEKVFPLIHSKLEKKVFNYSLLYKWEGEDVNLKPILLMSHIDVVPVDINTIEDWEAPPFSGEIKNGRVYGRGTMDDKVSVLGIMEAVETLISNGYNPEIGGVNGAGVIAQHLQDNNIHLEFVLDEGGVVAEDLIPGVSKPVAIINVAEKGYVSYELTIQTEGGHSSMPPKDNTIGSLATAITKLEKNPFKLKMIPLLKDQIKLIGAEMPFASKLFFANTWLFKNPILEGLNARTTTAPTIINGGVKDNVIPTTARVVVNFRIMVGDTPDKIKQHIIKTINDNRITVKEINSPSLASPVSDFKSEAYKTIKKTVLQIIPDLIVSPGLVSGATDTRHYEKISDNAFRFYPIRVNKNTRTGFHGINENIGVENYKEIVQFTYQFILNQN